MASAAASSTASARLRGHVAWEGETLFGRGTGASAVIVDRAALGADPIGACSKRGRAGNRETPEDPNTRERAASTAARGIVPGARNKVGTVSRSMVIHAGVFGGLPRVSRRGSSQRLDSSVLRAAPRYLEILLMDTNILRSL